MKEKTAINHIYRMLNRQMINDIGVKMKREREQKKRRSSKNAANTKEHPSFIAPTTNALNNSYRTQAQTHTQSSIS